MSWAELFDALLRTGLLKLVAEGRATVINGINGRGIVVHSDHQADGITPAPKTFLVRVEEL